MRLKKPRSYSWYQVREKPLGVGAEKDEIKEERDNMFSRPRGNVKRRARGSGRLPNIAGCFFFFSLILW